MCISKNLNDYRSNNFFILIKETAGITKALQCLIMPKNVVQTLVEYTVDLIVAIVVSEDRKHAVNGQYRTNKSVECLEGKPHVVLVSNNTINL